MGKPTLLVIDAKTGATLRAAASREESLATAQVLLDPEREEFDAARGLVRPKTVTATPDPIRAEISALKLRVTSLETELSNLRKTNSNR